MRVKLRVWDRIRSAVMGLIISLLSVGVILYFVGILPDWKGEYLSSSVALWQRAAVVAGGAVCLLLGLSGIGLLFRRRKEKGVVVQHTEYGDMSISMKAMENMVRKCVDAHPELNVNHTRIYHSRGGVCVDIKITLLNGVNIPLTVNALQKQIKQYITSCSGVDVHEVRVKVETDTVKLLPPPSAPVVEPAPVEEIKRVESPAEKQYQHTEEPAHYEEKPVQEDTPVAEPVTEIPAEVVEEPAEEAEAPAEEPVKEEKVAEEQPEETVETEQTESDAAEEANA